MEFTSRVSSLRNFYLSLKVSVSGTVPEFSAYGSNFTFNSADQNRGGGLYITGACPNITLNNLIFQNNTAVNAGGLCTENALIDNVYVIGGIFLENSAGENGAVAIGYGIKNLWVQSVSFSNNYATNYAAMSALVSNSIHFYLASVDANVGDTIVMFLNSDVITVSIFSLFCENSSMLVIYYPLSGIEKNSR